MENGTTDLAPRITGAVRISALKNEGIDALLKAVEDALPEKNIEAELLLPFSKSALAAEIRKNGSVISEEYTENGILMKALVDARLFSQVEMYRVK